MAESRTAAMAALLGNAALAVMKGVAAVSTGSAAMVAETFHSVADTGNQVLLFLGLRLSERPPDRAHGFGHGRDVYFWAFVVSLMLFSLGGAFSIWEGVRKLLHGDPHEGSRWWSYAVLVGAFLFESSSLVVAWRALASARGRKSLRGFWRDNRDPTVPTVVFEDTAALISLGIAALGIWLSEVTGAVLWTPSPPWSSAPCSSAWRRCLRWKTTPSSSARRRPPPWKHESGASCVRTTTCST